ncbi:MAG: hypothetical protein U1G07_25780 [Verrucomicrobiota bacterium]
MDGFEERQDAAFGDYLSKRDRMAKSVHPLSDDAISDLLIRAKDPVIQSFENYAQSRDEVANAVPKMDECEVDRLILAVLNDRPDEEEIRKRWKWPLLLFAPLGLATACLVALIEIRRSENEAPPPLMVSSSPQRPASPSVQEDRDETVSSTESEVESETLVNMASTSNLPFGESAASSPPLEATTPAVGQQPRAVEPEVSALSLAPAIALTPGVAEDFPEYSDKTTRVAEDHAALQARALEVLRGAIAEGRAGQDVPPNIPLIPLFRRSINEDGGKELRLFDPVGTFFSKAKALDKTVSPYLAIWRAENHPSRGTSRQAFLWRVYRHDRSPQQSRHSVLFGLFERTKLASGGSKVKVLWMPVS